MNYWNSQSMRTLKDALCYGEAFLCSSSSGSNYVLKRYKLSDEEDESEEELQKLQLFKEMEHPNIARVLDMKREGLCTSIALEYHETHLGLYPPCRKTSMTKSFIHQILGGLQHYHSIDLEHGDLRPQSVLVYADQGLVKIANYKLAFLTGHSKGNKEHDACYRAPEILYSYPTSDHLPADMWAAGCLFAQLVRGQPLFDGPSIVDRVDSIHKLLGQPSDNLVIDSSLSDFLEKFPKYTPKDFTAEFPELDANGIDLLSKLLCLDWRKRITSVEALNHPYFSY